MPRVTYKTRLRETSLGELTNDLQNLINELNSGVTKTTKELGEKSLDYMRKQYIENNMSRHTKNLSVQSYDYRYKHGFVISAGDDMVAVFNELGTGVVGEGTAVLADELGYKYNVDSPKKGVVPEKAIRYYVKKYKMSYEKAATKLQSVTTPNTWWYYKNGTWRHTKGMRAKNMFAGLLYELQDVASQEYTIGVERLVAKYRRRK